MSCRLKSRKRQPLEVLQGGSPKEMAIEHENGRLLDSLSEYNRPTPTAISPPPPSSPRNPTPLQYSARMPLCRSSFHSNSSRNSSMASPRYNVRPEDYVQTHPAFVRVTSDYEISNDRELASSQPVSLIQLYTKTNPSRNRPRRARASNLDTPDEVADFRGVNDTRAVLPDYSTSAEYGLRDDPGRLSPPSRLVPQEYTWLREEPIKNVQKQTWQPSQDDYHTQRNPLNYTSHPDAAPARESSYMSESPFLRRANSWDFPEYGTDSVSMRFTPQLALDTPKSNSYSQPHRKEYLSASSLQLYRESYDRPHDKSPYESIRLKHRNYRSDLPEITSGLMLGGSANQHYENLNLNTTIRSEPSLKTYTRERQQDAAIVMRSRGARDVHTSQDVSNADSRLSSGASATQRTLKEEIYAILDNMNLESRSYTKVSSVSYSEPAQPTSASARFSREQVQLPLQPSEDLRVDNAMDSRRSQAQSYDLKNLSGTQHDRITEEDPDLELGQRNVLPEITSLTRSATPPKRIIKPPPGFSEVKETMSNKALKASEERLREADAWFHTISRVEEPLRQQIAILVEGAIDSAECREGRIFSERERTTSKQASDLFGGAVANLQAYRSSGQKDYFTTFRPVESHYCDSIFGGRRSYFDALC